jgi:predicted lactoylglutathione lyase
MSFANDRSLTRMATSRKVFINLAVSDLKSSMAFFAALDFTFNKKFTDDNAASMVLNEDGYVMLLSKPFFQGFTEKQICDTATQTECSMGLSCESRGEVDEMVNKAIAAGAKAMDPTDYGFMYSRGFDDLDGHHWEYIWMDPAAV